MSSSDKKPVGFATHVIAGGLAGMSEAVRRPYPVMRIANCVKFTLNDSWYANPSTLSKFECNSRVLDYAPAYVWFCSDEHY